jgi:2-polyprenyl-3-methyl-5-hydroxy-6-metoxy-1,4-benzoquinol methylase
MKDKKEAVKAFFDNTQRYTSNNIIITLRKRIVRSITGDLAGKKVMDVGCGNGEISLQYLDGNTICFVDISDEMLGEVKKQIPPGLSGNAEFVRSGIDDLIPSPVYDLVICLGVLAHVPSLESAIGQLSRLVKKDGRVILQFTNFGSPLSALLQMKFILRNLIKGKEVLYETNKTRMKQIRRLVGTNGLRIIKKHTYFPVLPFMSLLKFDRRLRLLEYLCHSRIFSPFGNEVILVLERI